MISKLKPPTMKIVSWNAANVLNKYFELVDFINDNKPDIVSTDGMAV